MKEIKRITKVSCRKEEQETDIIIDPSTGTASVFSSVPTTINRLYKLLEHPDAIVEMDTQYGLMISVPMSWIKIRPPIKRKYTQEQREKMAMNLQKARKKKDVAV